MLLLLLLCAMASGTDAYRKAADILEPSNNNRPAAHSLSCTSSATSISVKWDAIEATDLYYVALSETATSRPFALQTSAAPSLRLIDLVPSTTYYLTLRSHPSSEQIVWGWRPAAAPVRCSTTAERPDAPNSLRRTSRP